MSPAEIEVIKQDVAGYLNGLRAAHIGWVVITSVLVWDIVRTMDKEIHYVWKSRWSYAKVIFLANRYLAPTTFLFEAIMLFRTPTSWDINQCIVPGWFWIILCTLTVTTVSFVLGSRVWAIYERDRRVLAGLLVGFMACFVPSWTLTFLAGVRGSLDADQLRVWGNVWLYMGGILMQDGLDGLDWRLRKCYRFPFPRATNSIVIGSLIYESGICAAMVWKMYQDKKKTRIIEAFYRDGLVYYFVMFFTYASALGLGYAFNDPIAQGFLTCGYYTAVKSMVCSHIILRLRSYFSDGDPIIDGFDRTDPFEEQLGGKVAGYETSSSFVSTIIHFAHVLSRSGGDVAFELRSKSVANGAEAAPPPPPADEARTEARSGATDFHVRSSVVLSSPTSRLRQELDWTDTQDPHTRRSILGEPSGSNQVVHTPGSPPEQLVLLRRLKLFRKRPHSTGREASASGSPGGPTTELFAVRSLRDPTAAVEMGDLTAVTRSGTIRRAISDTNLLTGDDRTLGSTPRSAQPPPWDPQSTIQTMGADHERSNTSPPNSGRADRK